MKLTPEQREIVDRYSQEPPVDVGAIAHGFGLEVYSTPLAKGVSGMLIKDEEYQTPSGYVCLVDADEPSYRQRFTAAHEIGHFILHKEFIGNGISDNYLLRAEGLSNRQEAEANRFAADLLMPKILIAQAMDRGVTDADDLAELFQVSKVAMSIRLGLPT